MAQSQGSKFWRGAGSPIVYSRVAGLVSLNDIDLTREALDQTLLDSDDNYREYEGGNLKNAEPIEIELKFDSTQSYESDLKDDFDSSTPVPYKITLPEGSPNISMTFNGLITKFGKGIPDGETIRRKITIQPSGAITYSWL